MWFGTSEGLCRFDGTSVKIYKHNTRDSTSLSHNEVNVLMEDADHTLWVGTSNGLNRYDRYHDNFVDVDDLPRNTNHPTNHFITALACDSIGQVWIGTWGGGLNIYNTKTYRYTYYLTGDSKDHYVAAGYVNGIVIHQQKAWIATRDGLKVFDIRNLRAETLNVDGNILRKEITSMVSRKNGDLLLGFSDGDIHELVLSRF